MIRVLIVEDEPPIARILQTYVGNHLFYEVVACKINGAEALKVIESEKVDVVFTDIRMPVMDGITLLKNLSEKYPQILAVILSGYREFSYAQAAIGYSAFDYLLKPITQDNVNLILDRLKTAYDNKTRQLYQNVIAGQKVSADPKQNCAVAALTLGCILPADTLYEHPGERYLEEIDLERRLNDITDGANTFLVFKGPFNPERIIVSSFTDLADARRILSSLHRQLQAEIPMPVMLVAHAQTVGITEIGKIIAQMNRIIYEENMLHKSQFIWRDVLAEAPASRPSLLDHSVAQKSVEAISAYDMKSLEAIMLQLLTIAKDNDLTQEALTRYITDIIGDKRLAGKPNAKAYSPTRIDIDEALASSCDFGELSKNLSAFLMLLANNTKMKGKKITIEVVDEIERFLVANYNKTITNEMLANTFGFVPYYIRKIFKQYKQVSPSEYVVRYRIQKANELMGTRPDILIRDVANMIGYDDPYYFSKIYKKETGIWPSEYQSESEDKP